jgi:hypothetical protein
MKLHSEMGINLEDGPELGALWSGAANHGQLIRKSVKVT